MLPKLNNRAADVVFENHVI